MRACSAPDAALEGLTRTVQGPGALAVAEGPAQMPEPHAWAALPGRSQHGMQLLHLALEHKANTKRHGWIGEGAVSSSTFCKAQQQPEATVFGHQDPAVAWKEMMPVNQHLMPGSQHPDINSLQSQNKAGT